jgi:hypothetical protein
LTPCDITFHYTNDRVVAKVEDPTFESFIEERGNMPDYQVPMGYDADHFAWSPRWALELEDGYSALYTTPLNRFELPFINTSGIIDNDSINTPGRMPFFLKNGWVGVLKKGTPFMQVLPFKREPWILVPGKTDQLDVRRTAKQAGKFRSEKTDYYRNHCWDRKRYKIERIEDGKI